MSLEMAMAFEGTSQKPEAAALRRSGGKGGRRRRVGTGVASLLDKLISSADLLTARCCTGVDAGQGEAALGKN